MTVRHRQRKGAKGKSFLYARGKAFPKPQLFRRNRPKIPRRHRITLHTPPAFSASFRPATAPLPALFAAKRGFFAPTPAVPAPERRPNAPFCPGAVRLLPGPAPEKGPAWPGFAPDPGPRTPLAPRKRPRVRLFAPIAPVFSRRAPPSARRNPARQARRPAKAHPWGWQTRLPWSAFPLRRGEACAPRGDQISEIRWLETAAHSRVKFREIRGPGYLPQKWIKRRDWR